MMKDKSGFPVTRKPDFVLLFHMSASISNVRLVSPCSNNSYNHARGLNDGRGSL